MRHPCPALTLAAIALVFFAGPRSADAARVKDVAHLAGVRVNQLQGYGIVTGLDGTGDSARSTFTVQSVAAMLSRSGVKVAPEMLRTKNVAAVMVTAMLPPFATPGSTLDVTVSSLGDAKSLRGGSLMLTPLLGVDGKIYAMSSGELAVGGFSASGGGSSVSKNHATAGRIPSGATIEQHVGIDLTGLTELIWVLHDADFTTASNMAAAISKTGVAASARDGRHVVIPVGEDRRADIVGLIAAVESVAFTTDAVAKVILNARTGTVVMGANVRIAQVALAHGGIEVEIATKNEVVQPGALAGGTTAGVRNAQVTAREKEGGVKLVKPTASLGDLVTALNALGVKPSDLIDILQAIKAAGALGATIEVQ